MSGALRAIVACAESPGHAFPGIALATALRDCGHEVLVQTSGQWREAVEGSGLLCAASEDLSRPQAAGEPWERWAVESARSLQPVMEEFQPDVVVSDVVAVAPPLAAELAGARRATLLPVLYPDHPPRLPLYPLGLLPPRTVLGARMWRALGPPLRGVLRHTRWQTRVAGLLNDARSELGLAPLRRPYGAVSSYGHPISEGLAMLATFPQLEYPRAWPSGLHITGPMLFELEYPDVALPEGEQPLVLVASSTAQDPEHALLRAALHALEGVPVRVVASLNRAGEAWPESIPDNAVVVDWVSYAQVMPRASLVICHGGHGTVVRALADGVPPLVCPEGGDMAVNGARVTWAGTGLMVPRRLLEPDSIRWAVRRLLRDPRFAARAGEIAAWGREHDGPARGAELVERYALR